MSAVLFFLAAGGVITGAVGVVVLRNPFYSVLALVAHLVSLAVLFLLLRAEFVAAVQVVVYAGAVMVLFLFVIMMLDLKEEERRKIKTLGIVGGLAAAGSILAIFLSSLLKREASLGAVQSPAVEGGTVPLAKLLFTQYLLPFEIVSVLLLVAIVGVVLLSKKDLK